MLVMVVPTFAPMIMGTAPSNAIEPEATRATTMEVVAELLCIIAVMSNPMKRPVKGFEVARIMVSAAVSPRCRKDEIIRSSANKNTKSAASI